MFATPAQLKKSSISRLSLSPVGRLHVRRASFTGDRRAFGSFSVYMRLCCVTPSNQLRIQLHAKTFGHIFFLLVRIWCRGACFWRRPLLLIRGTPIGHPLRGCHTILPIVDRCICVGWSISRWAICAIPFVGQWRIRSTLLWLTWLAVMLQYWNYG